MNLPLAAAEALQTFQNAAGWEQRARLLMQFGDRLPPLNDADKCEANRVHGCESQMWLWVSCRTVTGTSALPAMRG